MNDNSAQFEVRLRRALRKLLKGELLEGDEYQLLNCIDKDDLLRSIMMIYNTNSLSTEDKKTFCANIEALRALSKGKTISLKGQIISPLKDEWKDWQDWERKLQRVVRSLFTFELIGPEEMQTFANADRYNVVRSARTYARFLGDEEKKNYLRNIATLEILSLDMPVQVENKSVRPLDKLGYESKIRMRR